MAQARVGSEGIAQRKERIERLKAQIEVWESMRQKSAGLLKLEEMTNGAATKIRAAIVERVKTLQFATDADRLDLAKLAGSLDMAESVYYDIAEADKKIAAAKKTIAVLAEQIGRAKKGELLETGA